VGQHDSWKLRKMKCAERAGRGVAAKSVFPNRRLNERLKAQEAGRTTSDLETEGGSHTKYSFAKRGGKCQKARGEKRKTELTKKIFAGFHVYYNQIKSWGKMPLRANLRGKETWNLN